MVSKCARGVGGYWNADPMLPRQFLRLDSASTEDMLTDAAAHVLAAGGATALSLRAVAAWLKVTPARVSQLVTRDQLPVVVAARFAQRWVDWIEYRRWSESALALLPAEPEDVAGVRVWLALSELARHRTDLSEILDAARDRERDVLTELSDLHLDQHAADLVLATADGLRAALCGLGAALSVTEARSTFADLLELLGRVTSRAGCR